MQIKKSHKYIYFSYMSIVCFAMLLFYSYSSSPLYIAYGTDCLEYKLAGSAILDGLVIFRDIFHQKGALFVFVEAIGEFLCRLINNDRLGTFIIQYVNLLLSSVVICKTISLSVKGKLKDSGFGFFMIVAPLIPLFFWMATLFLGNQVEEFSMLYELVSVYITIKLHKESENEEKVSYGKYAFIYGICFAVTFWFKQTTSFVVIASVLFVGILLLQKKNFAAVFRCIIFGSLGIAVITAPLLIYYYANNALNDLIYQCFTFNAVYVSNNRASGKELVYRLMIYALTGVTFAEIFVSKNKPLAIYAFLIAGLNMIMFLITKTIYAFYIQVEVPALLVFVISLVDVKFKPFDKKIIRRIFLLLMAFMVFALSILVHMRWDNEYHNLMKPVAEEEIAQVEELRENADYIFNNKNEKKSLFLTKSYLTYTFLYYELKTYPCSNRIALAFFRKLDDTSNIDKFFYDFENNPPYYVLRDKSDFSYDAEIYDRIFDKLETDYTLEYESDNFLLYELNV